MEKLGRYTSYIIVPLAFIIVVAVIMRYIFNNMPGWAFEISLFLYGIHFMLGGGYTHLKGKHVAVDILQKYLSPGKKRLMEIVSELVVAFTSAVLIYISTGWALESIRIMERSMHQTNFDPPIWWFKCIVPVSAALLFLASLKNMLKLSKTPLQERR
jgi:TRAP-type C4-dicarboxylate transport system permease small subunit